MQEWLATSVDPAPFEATTATSTVGQLASSSITTVITTVTTVVFSSTATVPDGTTVLDIDSTVAYDAADDGVSDAPLVDPDIYGMNSTSHLDEGSDVGYCLLGVTMIVLLTLVVVWLCVCLRIVTFYLFNW